MAASSPTAKNLCETLMPSSGNKRTRRSLTSWPNKRPRRLFPPVQSNAGTKWKNKGKQRTSHLTVNGMLEVRRTIYWNKQRGTQAPMDAWLGILRHRYSAGVREMACRMSLDSAFVPATENLRRMSQLTISDEALRELVQRE